MILIDTNILQFCKDNNLSDDTYQKLMKDLNKTKNFRVVKDEE